MKTCERCGEQAEFLQGCASCSKMICDKCAVEIPVDEDDFETVCLDCE